MKAPPLLQGKEYTKNLIQKIVDLPELPGSTLVVALDATGEQFGRMVAKVQDSKIL